MKKSTRVSADKELSSLSRHLDGAVHSLVRFLHTLSDSVGRRIVHAGSPGAAPARRGRPPGSGKKARRTAQAWPWDDIMPVAEKLLSDEPARRWKPAEFCKAVRAAGVKLNSTRGMHFGLLPRLKERGLIQERGGTFASRDGKGKPAGRGKKGR